MRKPNLELWYQRYNEAVIYYKETGKYTKWLSNQRTNIDLLDDKRRKKIESFVNKYPSQLVLRKRNGYFKTPNGHFTVRLAITVKTEEEAKILSRKLRECANVKEINL